MLKICNKCSDDGKKWYPIPIPVLEDYLSKFFISGKGVAHIVAIRKNVAYNLQYLEFQSKLLKEFDTSGVILTQNWKISIIIGTSIIETILYYLIRSKELHIKTKWEKDPEVKIEHEQSVNGGSYKIINHVYKKMNKEESEIMGFDAMIKIVQGHKLLGSKVDIYKQLNYLKKLRNKIHLHSVYDDRDTDWYNFNKRDVDTFKLVVHKFLTSSFFHPTKDEKEMFNFLK